MKEIITALVKAQSEFLAIKKDKVNPCYKSKYADLEACIEGVKDALNACGLAVVQTFDCTADGKSMLITTLYHTSGESITGKQMLMCKDQTNPQHIASASTYARRYGLMAILGLAAEDDDGNNATNKVNDSKEQPKPATSQTPANEVKGVDNIQGEIRSGKYNEEKQRSEYGIETPDNELLTVFIKKPYQPELIDGTKVNMTGVWTSEFKGKTYYFAKDIKSVVYDDTKIPF